MAQKDLKSKPEILIQYIINLKCVYIIKNILTFIR